jgi:hypothetical protein
MEGIMKKWTLISKTHGTHRINMGRQRFIPKQHTCGVKVHRSVKLRMEAEVKNGTKYRPKAKLTVEPTWID